MNAICHEIIFQKAWKNMPSEAIRPFQSQWEKMLSCSNYPDYFDNPDMTDPERCAIDPQWQKYCLFPENFAARTMHFWPVKCTETSGILQMIEYLIKKAVCSLHDKEIKECIKFLGCISHYIADCTQPAHLIDLELLARLIPAPDNFPNFDYHKDIEAVCGSVGKLQPPQLLGNDILEISQKLAEKIKQDYYYCQRYVIPCLQAIFTKNTSDAQRQVSATMTKAAQTSCDIMFTISQIGRN